MDYEKAYKAVLETATQWIKDGCTDKEKICLECVFPELRESEDEKVRKFLVRLAERCSENSIDFIGDIKKADVLAWLEKQKEHHYTKRNALFDKCVENCDPKTVEEVNKRVDDIMNMSELSAFEQALSNFIGYWEDDEERWPSKFAKKHSKHILDMAREELQKEQKPAEWSEEDRLHYANVLDALEYVKGCKSDYDKIEAVKSDIAWLKSLRNRPKSSDNWKPSADQMDVLLNTEGMIRASGYPENAKVLASLYEQLKKL